MADTIAGLIYVGDPMCSWCWGFAPEIEDLAGEWSVEVVLGGLRPGPMAQVLDERMATFLRHEWTEIGQTTGQPFDTRFLDRRDGWVYDTEPAAIAVTGVRELDPERALDYFTDVQHAFYAESRDVTDLDVLADIATGHGVDRDVIRSLMEGDPAKKRAWADFSRARNWGISGFPTLVGELDDGRLALLARGWAKADVIRQRIQDMGEAAAV